MKVGLVSPYDFAHPGGVNSHVRQLGRWLERLGHEVRIFAPSSRRRLELETPGFYRIGTPIPIPANDSVARITLSLHLAGKVARLLEEEGFDVLHFHEPLMPTLPLNLLKISQTANVGTFHAFARSNLGYYYGRPLLKPYLRRLHATVAVSAAARNFVRSYFKVDPLLIPNGVDVETFHPGQAPIRHLRDGMVNILFVGRLEKRKGLRDLLRAYEEVKARVPRCRLVLVGDGPLRGNVESHISSRHLADVVMAGFVPKEVLPRYYASADIFCAPATGGESFGIVLLEAMATALPLVATAIPGYLSVVEPDQDGVIVPPRAPGELAQALASLAADPDLRKRLGEHGLAKARRYSWREVTGRIVEVYQRARSRHAETRGTSNKEQAGVHEPIPSLG